MRKKAPGFVSSKPSRACHSLGWEEAASFVERPEIDWFELAVLVKTCTTCAFHNSPASRIRLFSDALAFQSMYLMLTHLAVAPCRKHTINIGTYRSRLRLFQPEPLKQVSDNMRLAFTDDLSAFMLDVCSD